MVKYSNRKRLTTRSVIFFVASLLVMVGVAFLLSNIIGNIVAENILDQVAHQIADNTAPMVANQLSAQDFKVPMSGQRLKEFDNFVKGNLISDSVPRVKLWNKDKMVVYSNDLSRIGQVEAGDHEVDEAFEGEIAKEIHVSDKAENARERFLGTLMEIYVPLRLKGSSEIVGVLEVYELYAPHAEAVGRVRQAVFGTNIAGVFVIFGLMMGANYLRTRPRIIQR